MFDGFWPWWLGAGALAAVALGLLLTVRRPFGASGYWSRALGWRVEKELARAEHAFGGDLQKLSTALQQATLEEFGPAAGCGDANDAQESNKDSCTLEIEPVAATKPGAPPVHMVRRAPWSANLLFLIMLVAGGLLASVLRGDVSIRWDLGNVHASLFGKGVLAWVVLLTGGFLVGFGAKMAGGCTSWHGLYGAPRLQPGSILTVLLFFSVGIAVSFIVAGLTAGGSL